MFGSAQLGEVQNARTTMISVQPVFRGLPTQPQQSVLPTTPRKNAVASSSRSSPAKSPKPKPNYKCTYEGCDKSYSKPARLATHILSHTGERPFQCPECSQSYRRASHLAAHQLTHRPEEEKTLVCSKEGCQKRFWTNQKLHQHEATHVKAEVFQCDLCEQSFGKSHLLREHVALAHMPPGTKPYVCHHPGCTWSFTTRQKLRGHEKTHDATRYTCSHPDHLDTLPTFPNWSALRAHIKVDHPPTCPREECRGRTFKSTQHLKEHLKVHAQRDEDIIRAGERADGLASELFDTVAGKRKRRARTVEDESSPPKRLRRASFGEAARDWKCQSEGCTSSFKSAKALATHHAATHLGLRPFACPHSPCTSAFAYSHVLRRHIASKHTSEASSPQSPSAKAPPALPSLSSLLGPVIDPTRKFPCPAFANCHDRFARVYDVRRHLKSKHDLELEDDEVRALLVDACRA